ncbi:MAG: alginate lyase family protein [Bacteroidales bacterium]|nr:alginate lyase family protein [Bacteroidales bacterium]
MRERCVIFALFLLSLPVTVVRAQTDYSGYKIAGPYEVVARDGEFRRSKVGSERDMRAALECARVCTEKGSGVTAAREAHQAKALEIINAYARTLQRFDGHDAPLCCIQGFDLVRAMTLLRRHATPEWAAMVRRAILPAIDKFEEDSPYANGNWGAVVNRCRMACALFLEDSTLYRASVDYFLHAKDNGALPNYVGVTGQCQETGRDQGHVQLGLGMLCDICELAWEQGDDLWGAFDNRLMKGIEYTACYNLGYDVPFETWSDCTGLYCKWNEPGAMGRGRLWDIYRKPYEHYVKVKGLKMPYAKKVLAIQRKALKNGQAQVGQETTITRAPGVTEGKKLHEVFTYPAPEGAPLKHDYDVFIQPRGAKEWTRIDTYMAKVNAPVAAAPASSVQPADASVSALRGTGHAVSEISYAMFDFTGDVFVRVVCKTKKYKIARVRPDYRGVIANQLNDSTVQFVLFQPENVSVEFDGDITDNLLVFTSRPPVSREEAEKQARKQGRTFRYFAPGLYDEKTVSLASNTTVYLAGGAYFTGTFAIEDAHDVSIVGRGIARPADGYEGCHVHRSRNVNIDGLVLNTCPVGGSDGVVLHDVRSISHPGWGDGLNVFASSNVLYDRVFCRNSDDCTTAYATRKGFTGSVRNVRMRNSTLWADVAHPIFIGIHGNPSAPDSICDLVYENIDILCQSEAQVDYQGCLAINCGDDNLVRNVLFDNIRIESLHRGSILQVKVAWNEKYCTAPGRGVRDVTFRNVRYNGPQPYLSILNGYNEERCVENITFEGLKINGRKLYDDMPEKPRWYTTADFVPMYVGNHVKGLRFIK